MGIRVPKADPRLDRPVHECPDYCHQCPIWRNAVMPMCYGTIGSVDDMDLSRCTCTPGDPMIAKFDLAWRARAWLNHLRDVRRTRLIQRRAVKRLAHMAQWMKLATPSEQRKAWEEVGAIAAKLGRDLRFPQPWIDEGEAVVRKAALPFATKEQR